MTWRLSESGMGGDLTCSTDVGPVGLERERGCGGRWGHGGAGCGGREGERAHGWVGVRISTREA